MKKKHMLNRLLAQEQVIAAACKEVVSLREQLVAQKHEHEHLKAEYRTAYNRLTDMVVEQVTRDAKRKLYCPHCEGEVPAEINPTYCPHCGDDPLDGGEGWKHGD